MDSQKENSLFMTMLSSFNGSRIEKGSITSNQNEPDLRPVRGSAEEVEGAKGQDEWPRVAPTKYFLVGQQMGLSGQMYHVIGLASRLRLGESYFLCYWAINEQLVYMPTVRFRV